MPYFAKHISVSIDSSYDDVYAFISNPENLSRWAAGLSNASLKKQGEDWIADSPMGQVKVSFVEKNTYGVIDHHVTLPSGEVNYNPLRVVRNAHGSEVIFSLFRLPRMSDEEFQNDATMIEKDLLSLKAILEKS